MTKMLSARVVVPVDDDVTVALLAEKLIEVLTPLPITRLADDVVNGVRGGRIHWSAVDVLRGAERVDLPPRGPTGKRQVKKADQS